MSKDRSETMNLASTYPKLVKELEEDHLQWAAKVGVVDWNVIKNK